MFVVFMVGTAGSGKSLLTAAFSEWLEMETQKVSTVNLDPGVLTLPYSPDVDVRNYVKVGGIMEDYGLGPNGALILAADFIAEDVKQVSNEIEDLGADVVLVDTPGQMELFAFRGSGPYIARELTDGKKALVYLFDSVFSHRSLNFVSNLFLSAAVYNRFLLPQIHLLSKCDLVPEEEINRIVDWSEDHHALGEAIDQELRGTKRLLSIDMMQAIYQLGLNFMLIPVSAKTNEGMTNFNTALERVLTGGNKYTL